MIELHEVALVESDAELDAWEARSTLASFFNSQIVEQCFAVQH